MCRTSTRRSFLSEVFSTEQIKQQQQQQRPCIAPRTKSDYTTCDAPVLVSSSCSSDNGSDTEICRRPSNKSRASSSSRSIPIPIPRANFASPFSLAAESYRTNPKEEELYLKRQYETATWIMYHRINKHRREYKETTRTPVVRRR